MPQKFKITFEVEMTEQQIKQWMRDEQCQRRDIGEKIGDYIACDIIPLSNAYNIGMTPDIKQITATIPRPVIKLNK